MTHHTYLLGCCALMWCAASGAWAQQSPTADASFDGMQATQAVTESSETKKARNHESASLGEVVVTAERRAEPLQKVPIAISEVSAEQLADLGIQDITQINVAIPGVMVRQASAFALPYIRGIGSAAKTPLSEPPVATYVDDVYISSQTNILTFNNIADVEVDKGPQGTLYGRNTTGGVISVKTLEPTAVPAGNIDVGYGNYNTVNADGYVSGKIVDGLSANLAMVVSHQGNGFGRNLANGKDVYQNDYNYGLRSKWLLTPDESDRVELIIDYSSERNSLSNPAVLIPGTYTSAGLVHRLSGNPYDIDSDLQPVIISQAGGGSVHITHEFDSGFRIKSITAYRRDYMFENLDIDSLPIKLVNILDTNDTEQLTQEVQLQSDNSGRLSWTTGIFYFSATARYDPLHVEFGFPPTSDEYQRDRFTADSVAAYAQGTYALTRDTHLTAGYRYTYERRGISGSITDISTSGISKISDQVNGTHETNDRPSYRISLDHSFNAGAMVYASFNSSFKSGGYSVINAPPYKPETLEAYEVGLKSQFLRRSVTMDLAGFDYEYKNQQVQKILGGETLVVNGAAARLYGLDVDLSARVSDQLALKSGIELLHAVYTSYPGAPIGPPTGCCGVTTGSATGNYLPFAPKIAANVGLVHDMPLGGGMLRSTLLMYFTSRYYAQVDNLESQSSYACLNGSVRWESAAGISVKLWATNITNKIVMENAFDSPPTGAWQISYAQPRLYGITLGYAF